MSSNVLILLRDDMISILLFTELIIRSELISSSLIFKVVLLNLRTNLSLKVPGSVVNK